jgi:hypothetical protein
MSARQRVAKFYDWLQRRGESPYQQFQGDGAFKVINFAVLVTLVLLLFAWNVRRGEPAGLRDATLRQRFQMTDSLAARGAWTVRIAWGMEPESCCFVERQAR